MNNKKYLYALFIIIPIIIFFVARSFSLTYTQEIRNVEIESNDYDDPGSFHIDKSAKWTGFGKAQIEFNVNTVAKFVEDKNIDIILVFDISGSMSGDKFTQAISDAKDLANAILSQSGNRMALITFDTDSEIVSDFSSDKDEMIDYLDSLQIDGATNYKREYIDAMDDETFAKWMDYHFVICERQDLIGASHHTLDILQKD